ncbi:MAG TPA: 2-hydroxyacyl-CoA dehydratase [Candidatus Atribacteria bacterium]|mgnify:CR=1 FL=1|nr:2-hydroxyacyl-CoA dehydratase [Candidatus Atribacteria bacterium]HPT78234.1 2-hydroxyacyl-CoA dehydratase [Candidatus Atribacteria bacterium]
MKRNLQYDKDGRILFTKEMKKEYTILMPMMLPIHFRLFKNILLRHGYKAVLLETEHPRIVDEGLQSVHNDTCYPALLVIGQLLDALKSGDYDINRTALIITQTGGGCRASNYIHLLRKALKRNGLGHIPVISFNVGGMEKNPGFKLSIGLIIQIVYAILYGDLLMLLANQIRPYEISKGDTDRLVADWTDRIGQKLRGSTILNNRSVRKDFDAIVSDFARIPVKKTHKIRVGVVGEIYMKYSPLGNNNLESFLLSEGVEVVVPGLMDFVLYCVDNAITDTKMYGMNRLKGFLAMPLKKYLERLQDMLISSVKKEASFIAPSPFEHVKSLIKGYVGSGNKMGEGWLLTAEMLELIDSGVENIICTQPFGCLPNHIVGKGMIRKIRENHNNANIVAIDYDSGATRINQENRIKLMLSVARLNMEKATARSV